MEQTRRITEIVVIREGFLALTPFHYSLKEWELTNAGRKAKKTEMKKKKKEKLYRQSIMKELQTENQARNEVKEEFAVAVFRRGAIQKAVHELCIEEGNGSDVFTAEVQEKELMVAEFCKVIIQVAINELSEDEGHSTEAKTTTREHQEELIVAEFCKVIIQDATNELSEDEGHIKEAITTTREHQEELVVAEICKQMVLNAIDELIQEEGHRTEANRNITAEFTQEIKHRIGSLEKGEGDVGRAVTPADFVETKDDRELQETELMGQVDVRSDEPQQSTKTSLNGTEPKRKETDSDVGILKETKNKGSSENFKVTKERTKTETKAATKKEKKERTGRQKIEKEQIKATKKYFEMIDEAMKSRSIVLKLFWEKTVEKIKGQQKRQEKLRQAELKKERLEQKALEKLTKIQRKSTTGEDATTDSVFNETNAATFQIAPKLVAQTGWSHDDDGNNNHVISSKVGSKQCADDKTEKNAKLGSRVLRFFGRLYGEFFF